MADRTYRLHHGQSGSAITINLTTRASQNEISEILEDGTVKIRLTVPQALDEANKALLDYLSAILGVKSSQLEIVAGASGKDKLVTVANMDPAEVQAKIMRGLK